MARLKYIVAALAAVAIVASFIWQVTLGYCPVP
jgi:hypothetical protein